MVRIRIELGGKGHKPPGQKSPLAKDPPDKSTPGQNPPGAKDPRGKSPPGQDPRTKVPPEKKSPPAPDTQQATTYSIAVVAGN